MRGTQANIAMRVMDNSTVMIAHSVSHIVERLQGEACSAHDVEDGSFELSLGGEKYAGGSFYIDRQNNLILASVTPQANLGNVNNLKLIEQNLKNL
jgi:hypothetical protein